MEIFLVVIGFSRTMFKDDEGDADRGRDVPMNAELVDAAREATARERNFMVFIMGYCVQITEGRKV